MLTATELATATPALVSLHGALVTRLVRGVTSASDSAFARAGGTVVHWDSTAASRPLSEGLAVGEDVIVAALGRMKLPTGSSSWSWPSTPAAA